MDTCIKGKYDVERYEFLVIAPYAIQIQVTYTSKHKQAESNGVTRHVLYYRIWHKLKSDSSKVLD